MFNEIARHLGVFSRTSTQSLCCLETASPKNGFNIIAGDGSLATMIKVRGINQIISDESYANVAARLEESFKTLFKRGFHSADWTFSRDNDFTQREVDQSTQDAVNTAYRLNLDCLTEIDSNKKVIIDNVTYEDSFIMLWTYPTALVAESLKASAAEKREIRKALGVSFPDAQNILAEINDLNNVHDAFVKSFINGFKNAGIITEKLTKHEACRVIRLQIDAPGTDLDWTPTFPGDKILPRISNVQRPRNDISDLLWPTLGFQLCPRDIEPVKDTSFVRIGERFYAPLLMEVAPSNIHKFTRFFEEVGRTVPYRIRFLIRGDGIDGIASFRAMLASFTSFTASNKLIRDHLQDLMAYKAEKNGTVVKLQISLCTWADSITTLKQYIQILMRAFQTWGGGELLVEKGDKAEAFISTVVGFSNRSCATPTLIKINEIIPLLPFMRPGCTWDSGSILYTTRDNRLWSWQPKSDIQPAWIELWCARSGSGKSMTSNSVNFGLCLSAGLTNLPRLVIIDIGPGSRGTIQLLHDSLPEDMHYQAIYHKMQIHEDHAVNPFDLQLGCDYPLPHDLSYLIDQITLLATPLEGTEIPNMRELIIECIDHLYQQQKDPVTRKKYQRGINHDVDAVLKKLPKTAIDYSDEFLSWRHITDTLFEYKHVYQAEIAQRYAVPTLTDLVTIDAQAPAIARYKRLEHNGESILDCMKRLLSSNIKLFPCLSQPTKIGFSSARVCAIDLNDVATSPRATAVMYMLAKHVTTRDFYLHDDLVKLWPPLYRPFQKERIGSIRRELKRIVYEEYHRTKGQLPLRASIRRDCSEGRKWGINVAVISQLIEDFDEELREQATTIVIMGTSTEQQTNQAVEYFGLSKTAEMAMRNNYLHGPTKGGPCFLMRYDTKKHGWCEQLLRVPKSPEELWALSTTDIDSDLRRDVTDAIGGDKQRARHLLVKRFPGGSCEEHANNLKKKLAIKNNSSVIEDVNIMEQLIDEVIRA